MLYRKHQQVRRAGDGAQGAHRAGALEGRRRRGCTVSWRASPASSSAITRRRTSSYEKALELQPDDVTTLHAFARLLGDAGKWARAVELREHAAKSAAGRARGGALVRDRRHLREAARRRRLGAPLLRAGARARRALRGGADGAGDAAPHATSGSPELLEVLRRELKLAPDSDRQLELHLEMARAADQAEGGDLKAARGGLSRRAARSIRPTRRRCRARAALPSRGQLGRAGRGARARAAQRAHRARACARRSSSSSAGRSSARRARRSWRCSTSPRRSRARRAALADLYERRLNDPDAAARAWHRVDEADPRDPQAARALAAHLRVARSLRRSGGGDRARAAARRAVARAGAAPRAVAQARRDPQVAAVAARVGGGGVREGAARSIRTHGDALASLAEIYAALKRGDELNRVLDLRAQATTDPQQRASVLPQKGDLLERDGDLDGALAAYTESFRLDPTSRTCFTAFERVCYRREKWRQAMELYETAIRAGRGAALARLSPGRSVRAARSAAAAVPRRSRAKRRRRTCACSSSIRRPTPRRPRSSASSRRSPTGPGLIGAYERRAELVRDDAKRVEILRRAARVAAAKLKDAVEAARLYQRLHSVDPTDSEGARRARAPLRAHPRLGEAGRHPDARACRSPPAATRRSRSTCASRRCAKRACATPIAPSRPIARSSTSRPSHKEAIEALGRLYEGTEHWAELVEVTRRQIRIVNDRAQKALLYFKCGSVMESKFGKEDDAIRYYDAAIKTSPSCLPAVHGLRDLYLRKEDWPRVIQTLELEVKLWTEDKERAGVFAHIGQIYGDKLGDQERAIQYYESALTVDRECLPANRALFELYFARGEYPARAADRGHPHAEGHARGRSRRALRVLSQARRRRREDRRPARGGREPGGRARDPPREPRRRSICWSGCAAARPRPTTSSPPSASSRSSTASATPRGSLARVLVAQGALREREYEIEAAEQIYLEALQLAPDEYPRRRRAGLAARAAAPLRRGGGGARGVHRARQGPGVEVGGALSAGRDLRRRRDGSGARRRHARGADRGGRRAPRGALPPGAGAVPARPLRRGAPHLRAADPAGGDAGPHRAARGAGALLRLPRSHRRGARATRPARGAPIGARSISIRRIRRRRCRWRGARRRRGDRGQALNIIDEALKVAETRGPTVELQLRRGMARFFVAIDDRAARHRCLPRRCWRARPRATTIASRCRAAGAVRRARSTWRARSCCWCSAPICSHAPAYRLLVSVYQRAGDLDRAARVGTMLSLLGYAEADRSAAGLPRQRQARLALRRAAPHAPAAAAGARCLHRGAGGGARDARRGLRRAGGARRGAGRRPCPIRASRSASSTRSACSASAPTSTSRSRCRAASSCSTRPSRPSCVEASFVERPDGERRFLLGRAFEPLRGGYALVTRLRAGAARRGRPPARSADQAGGGARARRCRSSCKRAAAQGRQGGRASARAGAGRVDRRLVRRAGPGGRSRGPARLRRCRCRGAHAGAARWRGARGLAGRRSGARPGGRAAPSWCGSSFRMRITSCDLRLGDPTGQTVTRL